MLTRNGVPWSVALLLLGLAAIAWIQGLRAASVRQERLLPARASAGTVAIGDSVAVLPTGLRFALVELPVPPPARLGLYQAMTARTLVRWIEPFPAPARERYLVISLEGLEPGDYLVCAVDAEERAGPREMDQPTEQLEVVARFRLPASAQDR